MKYINAEKLIAEIERLYDEHSSKYEIDESAIVLDKLEDFIASLQQEQPECGCSEKPNDLLREQPEVDLEKEIKNYLATKCADDDEPSVSEIARHFYELGLNTRKEETK